MNPALNLYHDYHTLQERIDGKNIQWSTFRRTHEIKRHQSHRKSLKHKHVISQIDTEESFKQKCNAYIEELWRSIRQRILRQNSCDPYVKIKLIPNKHIINFEGNNIPINFDEFYFVTKPIFGGGANVEYTNADQNEYKFAVSSDEINIYSISLSVEVYDDDYFGKDRLIGYNNVKLFGLQNDIHMFAQIPLHTEDTKFCGKVEIAALRTTECLEITVLNATSLLQDTLILNYGGAKLDWRLIIMCLIMFILLFVTSTTAFTFVESSWNYPECLWFFMVTLFTVGYGNITPTNETAKLFNCVFILCSALYAGWAISIILDFVFTTKQNEKKDKLEDLDVDMTQYQKNNNGGYITSVRNNYNDYYFDDEEKYDDMNEFDDTWSDKEEIQNDEDYKVYKILFCNTLSMLLMICIGCIFFVCYEKWRFIDSLQFMCATITTVGYGTKMPETNIGFVITAVVVIFGVSMFGKFASDILEYVLQKQHNQFLDETISNSLTNYQQILKDFDEDGDGKIDKFEYLSRMLLLTNETRLDMITKIMQKFEQIDKDNSGFIDVNDLLSTPSINN